MGGEKNAVEDKQPPMCGGAVFNKLRLKHREKKERSSRQSTRSFDQRTIHANSPSATSSDNSYEEGAMGPGTALLNESSQSQRGSRFLMFQRFKTPILEKSPYQQEDSQSEFLTEGHTKKLIPEKANAVEFDPNDVSKLRSQHIKSMAQKDAPVSKSSVPSKSSHPSSSPAKKGDKDSLETNPRSHKHEKQRSMEDVVAQQRETLKIMSSQNQFYRRKLGAAQTSFHKLYKNQMSQADVIEKLQLEKDSFEAETMLLREEMKAVRHQLDLFQKQLSTQSQPDGDILGNVGQKKDEANVVTIPAGTTLTADYAPRKGESQESLGSSQPPKSRRKPELSIETEQEEIQGEPAADPAENYWKREWELSIRGMVEPDSTRHETNGEADDGSASGQPNDLSCEYSESTESPSVASLRGVDPPEDKKSENKKRKDKKAENKKLAVDQQDEYQKDMDQVHQLLEKYQKDKLGIEGPRQSKHLPTETPIGREFDEARVVVEEQEALVEIENMFEVDRVYKQRQAEMARLREAYEKGELMDPETMRCDRQSKNLCSPEETRENMQSRPPHHNVPTMAGANDGHSSRSQSSRVRFKQPCNDGTHMAPVYEYEPSGEVESRGQPLLRGSLRLKEPTVPEYSQGSGDPCTFDTPQDETYRTERTDYGPVVELSDYGPVVEQSKRSHRLGYDPRYEVSQHSESSEYADHIEHSTSRHHAFLWAQSGRSERTRHLAELEGSMRVNRAESDALRQQEYSHGCGVDNFMAEESERSGHTLAEVHEPAETGRKGGIYKIKMTSRPSHRQETQQADVSNGSVPSDRARRSIFSRQTGVYGNQLRQYV